MNSDIPAEPPPAPDHGAPATPHVTRRRTGKRRPHRSSLAAHAEPMVWLTGGSLVLALLMITGLLTLILVEGSTTFWPGRLQRVTLHDGRVLMGELSRSDSYTPTAELLASLDPEALSRVQTELQRNGGKLTRRLLATGNFELTMEHFNWVNSYEIASEDLPEWACFVERLAQGPFYGIPVAFIDGGNEVASTPEDVWNAFGTYHAEVRDRWQRREHLNRFSLGAYRDELEAARLRLRAIEIAEGVDTPKWTECSEAFEKDRQRIERLMSGVKKEIAALDASNARYKIRFVTASGQEQTLDLADIVRAYPANRLDWLQRLGVYVHRTWEFLSDWPRQANNAGGIWPAIFGTIVMTLLMCLVVVPIGVCAALYLREYAKPGPIASAVRIAVNNLAGVPSIVFGVFGLGFFCYILGARIDELFFTARLPSPTFGTGGVLWASLTLALLTLPVVIVATEEAIAAVPSSMREGSYACGASKWQTIRRIVLPRATPGIITGAILALARGAGEVAPLMLVGVVKLAPDLLVDSVFPYIHPERSFMHLGFHIYDLGFQSQNSEAAKPMVYTTTLLLILIITILNVSAIFLRTRLRRKFVTSQF